MAKMRIHIAQILSIIFTFVVEMLLLQRMRMSLYQLTSQSRKYLPTAC